MKKIVICLMATCLSLTFLPLQSIAATNPESSSLVVTKPPEPVESTEAKAMMKRLEEIKEMDMSKLKATEKKNLRKEVRETKRNLRDVNGGVYVSAGALILIVILLIILL